MERHPKKPALYADLARRLDALLSGESDWIANAANMAALVFEGLPDLNWAGFYLVRGEELVLGPFQGRVACVRIPMGRGVCGTAAAARTSVVVENVHQFEGHIACDAASNAELVVPIVVDGVCVGVFDLDSPKLRRFDDEDRAGVESLVEVFVRCSALDALAPGVS